MGLVCIKGSVIFLVCEQAHYCEFGKNFGGGSASVQGKATFPCAMAALLLKFFLKLAQMAQVSPLAGW